MEYSKKASNCKLLLLDGYYNSNNSEFWIKKISRNMERDDEINKKLNYEGWTVIRFWGEDIKKYTDECVKTVEEAIFDVIICDNDEG